MPGESPSTDPPWVMPDGFLVNVITHGGSVEGLSPGMPALGGYLSDAQVRQVILYVRSLASPPFQAAAELQTEAVPGAPQQPRSGVPRRRSEEHTSELQSQSNLGCRLLLENNNISTI